MNQERENFLHIRVPSLMTSVECVIAVNYIVVKRLNDFGWCL